MSNITIQIRNVPSDFRRRLKARAAIEGMSMSVYILREIGNLWTGQPAMKCSSDYALEREAR